MNNSAIVVCSGGLDSVTLAHWVMREKSPSRMCLLFFRYGQKQEEQEKKAVEDCYHELWKQYRNISFITIVIPRASSLENDYVPSRNLIFATHVLTFAEFNEYDDIYFGFISSGKPPEEDFWDSTPKFISNLNDLCERTGKHFYAPLLNHYKFDVYKLAKSYGIDLKKTWSCMHPEEGKECRKCMNCKLRGDMEAGRMDEEPPYIPSEKWYNLIVRKVRLFNRHQ